MFAPLALLSLSAVLAQASPASPQCTDFLIPVTASASNSIILDPTNQLTTLDGVTSFLSSGLGALGSLTGLIPVSGTYNISGRYCTPTATPAGAPASRSKTLQVLLHGIPYNKDYWQGLHFPDNAKRYSWVDYATAQGYPVLSVDNLGKGNSSKPDAITVCQQALETELIREVILKARTGQIPQVPRADKVVFVGHSVGSVLGNGIATRYPKAFDAAILTGYTHTLAQSVIGLLLDVIEPASIQNPSKFGSLSPAYLTFASVEGKRNTYYSAEGDFDPALPQYDISTAQDTVTLGEILTAFTGEQRAPDFHGDVFVVTGNQDALFCSLGSRAITTPDCGSGNSSLPARSKDFWPNANYDYFIPVGGHAVTLHYSAQEQFKQSHDFLAKSGY